MTKISVKACWAVALVLVLVHISVQTCEASSYAPKGRRSFHDSSEPRAASLLPSGTPKGETYRPPIVNFKYQGGRIMWKPVHVYFVWYGTWTEEQKEVVRTATNSLTPKHPIAQWPNLSNMYKLVTEYFQELPGESRKYASKSVTIAGEIDDAYSFGHTIDSLNDPLVIIADHIANHNLPEDYEQGIYFLFTSGDVTFKLIDFCAYHTTKCNFATTNNSDCPDWSNSNFIYAFVPLPSDTNGLLVHCTSFNTPATHNLLDVKRAPNKEVSPDGGLDGMMDSYIHELLETIVDPYLTAWLYNVTENSEVEDLCEFNYAAGDWWYCYVPSIYPDFPANTSCTSKPNLHTLVEPKSKAFFNVYGNHGSQFLIQKIWSLEIKGCATQPVENCGAKTVVLRQRKGTIQKGLFFGGVGLQVYAPGESCKWKILVRDAKFITLYFEIVALTYDELDYITVGPEDKIVQKKLTGFGKNIKVTVPGNEAHIHFHSYGGRSPQPKSAGFSSRYVAGYH